VHAKQALAHKLNEFGIGHEAEEYDGLWGEEDRVWRAEGPPQANGPALP